MNFIKQIDSTVISIVFFSLFISLVYFYKDNEVNFYKEKLTSSQEDLIKEKTNLKTCEDKRQEQNKKIEDMRVEVTYKEPEIIEKINNIYLKDKTCESELKAYKELFND